MECHEFDIEIRPNGEVKIHVKGVKGPGCLEYARWFEKILGNSDERILTHEYYEPPTGVAERIKQELEK